MNDVLESDAAPEKNKPEPDPLEHLDTELEEMASYGQPTLPPLSNPAADKDSANANSPDRPSHFVPFAPGLVATDEPEQS
jgi:hypothetical protein